MSKIRARFDSAQRHCVVDVATVVVVVVVVGNGFALLRIVAKVLVLLKPS